MLLISQRKIRQLKELHSHKGRRKYKLFFGETHKILEFVLAVNPNIIEAVYGLETWYRKYSSSSVFPSHIPFYVLDESQLRTVSLLKNPRDLLFTMKQESLDKGDIHLSTPVVMFDAIQDPGNFGTIIRTMAWFGVKQIICSPDSVDIYNPKVIQASMGAFCLVKVHYLDIEKFIISHPDVDFYYTDMQGESIYSFYPESGKPYAIIFGNEGKGVSATIKKLVAKSLSIPPFATDIPESLNLSMSAGIIISELSRKSLVGENKTM